MWSELHREMSAVLETSVGPCLCLSAHCLSSLIRALDYGANIMWIITANPCNTNFPLRIISVDKTGYWRRTLLLPIVFRAPHPKAVLVFANPPVGCSQGSKYRNMTIVSGHMIVTFLSNCSWHQSKQLLHSHEIQHCEQRPCLHVSGVAQAHITLVELCVGGKDFASCLRLFLYVH